MKEIIELKKQFDAIKEIGWIKERCKGPCSIGYTFEEILGKNEDNFPVSDYHSIEIKTHNKNSKRFIHLFSLTPDGEYLFPIERIIKYLGYKNKDGNKVFYRSFNSNDYTRIIYGRKGKLLVDYDNKKIKLIVFDKNGTDINLGISWSFDYIERRLKTKLRYLAIIIASSCIICGEGYYHYDSISFYKLREFDIFLKAIENGYIYISFKIGAHKEQNKLGKVYDHGTDFAIDISNIYEIYDEIKN